MEKIELIRKGWSNDTKYHIETENSRQLLLRISDIEDYEQKNEFEIIKKYATLGFEMSQPVDFGVFNKQQNVYIFLTWVKRQDLEQMSAFLIVLDKLMPILMSMCRISSGISLLFMQRMLLCIP